MKNAIKRLAVILLAKFLCWPLMAQAAETVLVISSVNNQVPWQGGLELGLLERSRELRFETPHGEHSELYFATVDWFRKVPERTPEDIALDLIGDFEGVVFDRVIVIGQPASHVFELAQENLGNPAAEYVDTSWVSGFGLDRESLRQPELVYQSVRNIYPSIQRLIYLGNDSLSFQDQVDFDTGTPIELVALGEFDTHDEWEAFIAQIGSGDLVLVDSAMIRIGAELHFPYHIVAEITEVTDVPLMVTQSPLLELDGVLGGLVLDSYQLGRALADISEGLTPDLSQISKRAYNYSELERFGLNTAGLAGDVEIRGEPVIAMSSEQFKGYVALGSTLLGAFMLAWLYRERSRNRKLSEAHAQNSELYAELKQRQRNAGLALDAAQIAHYSYEHSTGVFQPDERFKRLYGAQDKTDFDFSDLEQQIHPEDREQVLMFRRKTYEQLNLGQDFSVNYRIRPIGREEYIWLKAFARQYQIDDQYWTLGCIFSIDAEMKAKALFEKASIASQQTLDELQMTAELGNIGFCRHNLRTDLFEVNSVFRRLFDFPQTEYPTIYFDDFCSRFPAQLRTTLRSKAIEARREGGYSIEASPVERRDGSVVWVKVQLKTWFEQGVPVDVVGSFVDITAAREMSRELKQIAQDRQSALEALERRQQAQQQMFAVIGHELRTPAAALSMMLDSQLEELTEEEVSALPYAKDISAAAKHLMDVLDDLRAVVEPESINFRTRDNATPLDVVEGCLAPLRDRLKTANLWVQINAVQGAAEWVSFDAKGMRQIITNLVKNAAIHSGASELKLGLLIELNDEAQKQLRVELADNGKGIPQEQWESIFEPFARGDTEADGTGLGLYICREIARASGGELTLDASPDGGCRFTLLMPLDEVVEEVEPKTISLGACDSLSGKSILFAEDNLTLRMLTEQILKALDAKYQPAINGAEALELAAGEDFDLVLTDIFMPEVDGFELVETLRKRGFNKPIIGITAAMVGDETERLLAAGADIVVPKPVTRDKLEAAWLEIQEARPSEA